MSRWSRPYFIAILTSVMWTAFPIAVAAQSPPPGSLGVFFDAAGTQRTRAGVVPFAPFDFHVTSFDVPGGMLEYEFGLQLPAGMLVTAGRQLPAHFVDSGAGDDNWIVATAGECVGAVGGYAVVTYAGALFLTSVMGDTPICLEGATPSRFVPGTPGYLGCVPPGELHAFGAAFSGCAVLNPTDPPECWGNPSAVSVSSGATSMGLPVSLLVTYTPPTDCIKKDDWGPNPVIRIELNLAWDPDVATLTAVRWPYTEGDPPGIEATLGAGIATVALDRPSGIFDWYSVLQLVWLDFVAGSQAGLTPVIVTRNAFRFRNGAVLDSGASPGTLTVGSVAAAAASFGGLKALYSEGGE